MMMLEKRVVEVSQLYNISLRSEVGGRLRSASRGLTGTEGDDGAEGSVWESFRDGGHALPGCGAGAGAGMAVGYILTVHCKGTGPSSEQTKRHVSSNSSFDGVDLCSPCAVYLRRMRRWWKVRWIM